MTDEGWEARMAARARARRSAEPDQVALATAARARYIAQYGECVLSPEPPDDPEICRECYAWGPIGNWPGVYCWHLTCNPFVRWDKERCSCAHHADEIWLASAA